MKGSAACLVVGVLLVAAPQAGAEVLTSEPQTVNTVSVVGIGRVPIPVSATAAQADTAYHQALVQAVSDGLLKARLLAEATGARVGPIEAISEDGRKEVECKDAAAESASYKGVEPDAGKAGLPTIAVEPTIPAKPFRPPVSKKRKTRKSVERKAHAHKVLAKKAENVATSCELTTEVSLIYNLS